MLVITVRHILNPGQFDAAWRRIVGNTDAMQDIPGFLFRHTGVKPGSQTEITTVTAWRDAAARAIWEERRKVTPPAGDPKVLFSGYEIIEVEVGDARWGADLTAAIGPGVAS